MNVLPERYDRNIRLFGKDGQRKLLLLRIVVVGIGGLGSALVQHLALLGVGCIVLVDFEELDDTNRNRLIGARHNDLVPGCSKVALSERLIREIDPKISVETINDGLISEAAFAAIKGADVVIGCLDEDGPRSILNELCAAYCKQYIDLASDVPEPGVYGGRVCVSWNGDGCLLCMEELDSRAVQRFMQTDEQRESHDRIYGITKDVLEDKGPSVSPINGVVAALAATEFMVAATGMRKPFRLQNFRGHTGTVSIRNSSLADCYICKGIRGQGPMADVERYLRMTHLVTYRKRLHKN